MSNESNISQIDLTLLHEDGTPVSGLDLEDGWPNQLYHQTPLGIIMPNFDTYLASLKDVTP